MGSIRRSPDSSRLHNSYSDSSAIRIWLILPILSSKILLSWYAPNRALLQERWAHLISAPASEKAELFKEGSEPRLESTFPPLPGIASPTPQIPLVKEKSNIVPPPVRVGFRSFDRQWIIPDNRVLHRARPICGPLGSRVKCSWLSSIR